VLGLAKRRKAKILQASTSKVYGDTQVSPQLEDYWGYINPIKTRSCYDIGKHRGETLFFDYHRLYEPNIKVVRIFITYGTHMFPNDGGVVFNFVVQTLKDERITVYGHGTQTRSICYVDDLIDAFALTMATDDEFTGR
jgi:UDP-glucuronate decarboxylase